MARVPPLFRERRYFWRDVRIAYILMRLWLFRFATAWRIGILGQRQWLIIWKRLDEIDQHIDDTDK
jgi:hypothetical protein